MLAPRHVKTIRECAANILTYEKEEKERRFIQDLTNVQKNIRQQCMLHSSMTQMKKSYAKIHGVLDRNNSVYMMGQLLSIAGIKCHFYERIYLIHIRMQVEYIGSIGECIAPEVSPIDFQRENHIIVVNDPEFIRILTSNDIDIDVCVRVSKDKQYCIIF